MLRDVLLRFGARRTLSDLEGFFPETIDVPENNEHFEHCMKNIKGEAVFLAMI